jgi:hypothetical protein
MKYKVLPQLSNFVTQTIILSEATDANDSKIVVYVSKEHAEEVLN